MGQRTAILVKKQVSPTQAEINLIHHQWGIGKTLPALFMEQVLSSEYSLDRSWRRNKLQKSYNFEPLSNEQDNYIYKEKVLPTEVDVWNIETIKDYFEITDNNNGGMIIEITPVPRGNDDEIDWESSYIGLHVKVGFVLGNEECNVYYENKRTNTYVGRKLEEPFSRIVSAREFMLKTGASYVPSDFIKCWNGFVATFGIEEAVSSVKSKKKVDKKVVTC